MNDTEETDSKHLEPKSSAPDQAANTDEFSLGENDIGKFNNVWWGCCVTHFLGLF